MSAPPVVPPLLTGSRSLASLHDRSVKPGSGLSSKRSRPLSRATTASSLASQTTRDGGLASRRVRTPATGGSTGFHNLGAQLGLSHAAPNPAVLAARARAKAKAGSGSARSEHSWITTGRTGASEAMRARATTPAKLPWMTPRDDPADDKAPKFRTRSQLLRARKAARSLPAGIPSAADAANQAGRTGGGGIMFNNSGATANATLNPEFNSTCPPPIGVAYVDKPRFRTRSELLEHRRQAKLPPLAYDFDGDGVVDNFELFLGTRIDTNGDGRIDTAEREKGKDLLLALKDVFTFGLEAGGANQVAAPDLDAKATLATTGAGGDDAFNAETAHQVTGVGRSAAEAVVPPFAVSERRGLHDSARSRWSDYGAGWRITQALAADDKARAARGGGGGGGGGDGGSRGAPPTDRPRTGMSSLIGV